MNFCIVDSRADLKILNSIEKLGYEVLPMPPNKNVSVSCSSHPDISLFRLSNNQLIYSKDLDNAFLYKLEMRNIQMIEGDLYLSSQYPDDIKYNAAKIGNYLIHKLNSTDGRILKECEARNMKCLNVKQGYSGCSTAVIRDNLAITSDKGIYDVLKNTGDIHTLLIKPQESIRLFNEKYGFIGGASGRIDDDNFALSGDVDLLESGEEIKVFFKENNVKLICLSDEKPVDLGTLMFFTL